MKLRLVYKTLDEYQDDLADGELYEGFVIGAGYASISDGYEPSDGNQHGTIYYQGQKSQILDTSDDLKQLSYQTSSDEEFREIIVLEGDTLSNIALELGITLDQLLEWNKEIHNPNNIYIGQKLFVDINKIKVNSKRLLDPSQEEIDSSGIALSMMSLGLTFTLNYNNHKYLAELAQNNQFIGTYKGVTSVMDKSFLSTHRMKVLLEPQQTSFLKKVSWLNKVKYAGNVLNGLSIFCSVTNFLQAETKEKKWEYGIDTIVGVIGLCGIYGGIFALNYDIHKVALPYYIQYSIEYHEEIKRTNSWSMALGRPGRSIR